MIEKSLFLRDSAFSTLPYDPNASSKALPSMDLQSKRTKGWNQLDLGYFNLHLNRAHVKGKIVSVDKDVYYRNVVLFVQCLQSLLTFKKAALVKINVAIFFWGSALEWYTSELSNFDRIAPNNNPRVKSWVNTFSYHFKVPTSIALSLLTDETYSLNDARIRRPATWYVCNIMRYGIGCNIVNVTNELFFAYQGLALEFQVFVFPLTEFLKASDFIWIFEEK